MEGDGQESFELSLIFSSCELKGFRLVDPISSKGLQAGIARLWTSKKFTGLIRHNKNVDRQEYIQIERFSYRNELIRKCKEAEISLTLRFNICFGAPGLNRSHSEVKIKNNPCSLHLLYSIRYSWSQIKQITQRKLMFTNIAGSTEMVLF